MKADVLDRVDMLSNGMADASVTTKLYDEVVADLGKAHNLMTKLELLSVTSGTDEYTAPDDTVRILALFYGSRQLSIESVQTLDRVVSGWRPTPGTPLAAVVEETDYKTFKLYPKPNANGDAILPGAGALFGSAYPDGNLAVLYTDARANVLPHLELIVALLVLYREFSRESDHTDKQFAAGCMKMGLFLLKMVA